MSLPIDDPTEKLINAFRCKNPRLTKEDLVCQLKILVKEEAIEPWFSTPNRAFDGLSPNQVIALGDIQLIQDLILDMASGTPS